MFHAIDPNDGMFCLKIKLSKWQLVAISLARQSHPEWQGIVSPYEAFHRDREKEAVFERIRAIDFPSCPPRLGAIFLFPTEDAANRANRDWWSGARIMLPATITFALRQGELDAKLLEVPREDWEAAATRYWSGDRVQEPAPEMLIDGIVQLEGWEPYAKLFGQLPKEARKDVQ